MCILSFYNLPFILSLLKTSFYILSDWSIFPEHTQICHFVFSNYVIKDAMGLFRKFAFVCFWFFCWFLLLLILWLHWFRFSLITSSLISESFRISEDLIFVFYVYLKNLYKAPHRRVLILRNLIVTLFIIASVIRYLLFLWSRGVMFSLVCPPLWFHYSIFFLLLQLTI